MDTSPNADESEDDMLPEYDFTAMKGAVRGKYAARDRRQFRTVRLAEDVFPAFPDDEAVNAALREYLRIKGTAQ